MPRRPSHYRDDDPLLPRLAAAVAVSLMAHLTFFSVVQLGNQLQWWDARPFSLFRKVRMTPEEIARLQEEQRKREEERQRQQQPMELTFVQVTQPSDQVPPEAKFYSSQSSRAANPDPSNAREVRVDGTQERMIRMENVPRALAGAPTPPSEPEAPQVPAPAAPPSPPPPPPPPPPPVVEAVAQAELPALAPTPQAPDLVKTLGVGELAVLRPAPRPIALRDLVRADAAETASPTLPPVTPPPQPSPTPPAPTAVAEASPTPVTPPRSRPRSLTEAKMRQALLSGEKMRQEGGVARRGPVALDVKGMPFGAYDEALVMAVQNRWFSLLDERRFAGGATGKVIVTFKLYSDGSVRIVEPQESSVDALLTSLCVRAIRDPAPFAAWPSDMLRMVGSNFREMRFTFFYN